MLRCTKVWFAYRIGQTKIFDGRRISPLRRRRSSQISLANGHSPRCCPSWVGETPPETQASDLQRTGKRPRLTPDQFIAKWKSAELTERAAAQSHFIHLCHLLEEPTPSDVDKKGEWYAFERGATKTTGGEGWADVWKRDHFG